MNNVSIVGRITKNLEIKTYNEGDGKYTSFTIAVQDYLGKEESVSFIDVVAFGKKAEVLCSYGEKGTLIAVNGKLKSSSYINREGIKRYTTNILLEDFKFLGKSKKVS